MNSHDDRTNENSLQEYNSLVASKYKYTNQKISTYHNSSQEIWASFSEKVVSELAEKVKKSDEMSLLDLLSELGKKRNIVAQELHHGDFHYVTESFGNLRGIDANKIPGFFPREVISEPDSSRWDTSRWEDFYDRIYTAFKITTLIDPDFAASVNSSLFKLENTKYNVFFFEISFRAYISGF